MDLPILYSKTHYTVRRLVREEYIKRQGDKCYHCKSDIHKNPPNEILDISINKRLFPTHFFNYPIHLHHDHGTDLTIGAVHNYCNAVLWQYYGK